MKQGLKRKFKRITSGFLALAMSAILTLSDAGIALAADADMRFFQDAVELAGDSSYSRATVSNASFQNHTEEQMVISVMSSEDSDFRAGGTVFLDVHIKNETDQMITDGVLTYKGKGIEEDSAFFEELLDDPVTDGIWTEEEYETEEEIRQNQSQDEIELINDLDVASPSDYDWDDDWDFADEDGEQETDEEEDEFPQKLEGIELAPGQIYSTRFVYTIDESIEKAKNQNIRFRFKGNGEEERISQEEVFYYTVNYLNIDSVRFEEGNRIETGEEAAMGIHASMYDFDAVLSDSQVKDLMATPADAKKDENGSAATASNAEKASWSNAEEATPSDADVLEEDAKEAEEAGEADADEEEEVFEDEEDKDEFVVDLGKTSYEIQMINAKLNDFEIRKALVSDADDNMLICTYRVSNRVKPGVYFGRIIQECKAKGRTYKSSQGFSLIVTGEGEIELEGKAGDTTITVTGPADSFPDANQLSVRVAEVEAEQQARVDAALEKKVQEEGGKIRSYKALDIKLYADGVETEPTGPIQVTFKNVEWEKKQEGSLLTAAAEALKEIAAQEADAQEAEEAVIKVFHLDEEAVIANEMNSRVHEDGTVVMDTDHFSVYIVVDLDQLGGSVNLTVQHWAKLKVLDGVDRKDGLIKSDSYDGIAGNATASLKRTEKFTEIYSSDTIPLDNGLDKDVQELSKIILSNKNKAVKNYEPDELWVLKEGKSAESTKRSDWTIYNKDQITKTDAANKETVTLEKDAVIRMVYTPVDTENTQDYDVTFFDYDVTDGVYDGNKVNTANKGINSSGNYSGGDNSNRLAVGMYDNGFLHNYKDVMHNGLYVNQGQDGDGFTVVSGMVKGIGDDGPVYNGLYDAGLFNGKAKNGKTIHDNYSLRFNQLGDTYTLSSVYKGNSQKLKELETFKEVWDDGNRHIFANNFWPLDSEEATDPKFGGSKAYFNQNGTNLGTSDDGKAHNWFFGMRFDLEFTVGDYTGPLSYYFRGDDDFWLFVDGVLKTDIGGIHSSVGENLSLDDLKNQPKDKLHTITVIYAERGGYGSSCYMEFTLPNVQPVSFDTSVPKTDVKVIKKWDDHGNPYRPSGVRVQLQYREGTSGSFQNYGKTVTLTGTGDEWSYTWKNLPKEGYQYRVNETVPAGYQAGYSNSSRILTPVDGIWTITITNRLNPEKEVLVEKNWNDAENQDGNRPASVQMQLFWRGKNSGDASWQPFPGDAGLLTLDGTRDNKADGSGEYEPWKGRFLGLPEKITSYGTTALAEYTVFELNGSETIQAGQTLSGKRGTDSWNYTVTYAGRPADGNIAANILVTNQYTPKTVDKSVKKIWENMPEHMEHKVTVALYKKNGSELELVSRSQNDNPKELTKAQASYTWKDLPVYNDGTKIEYLVCELDKNQKPITGDGLQTLGDTYVYTVKTTVNGNATTITNTLKTARLWVKKLVVNENGLPNEPIDKTYKFMIRLTDVQTGKEYTCIALSHDETSGYLEVIAPEEGRQYRITEIVPMEYEMTGMAANVEGRLDGTENGSVVTVKPGDDILVTLTNKPAHEHYFHHTASVTNTHKGTTGGFQQKDDYREKPNENTAGSAALEILAAVLPERIREKNNDDVRLL